MATNTTIEIACLNIVTHPHSPLGYLELFDSAATVGSVHLRDNTYIRIQNIRPIGENPVNGIKGKIFKHLKISEDTDWLVENEENLQNSDEVDASLPDDAFPEAIEFDFVFYPRGHRLFYSISDSRNKKKKLTPGLAEKALTRIFQKAVQELGEVIVHVTIETSQEGIDKVLSVDNLNTLEYEIKLPNPDDGLSAERDFQERLERQNISKLRTKMQGDRNSPLTPDEATIVEATVAASNGYVIATGSDSAGQRQVVSTKDHPYLKKMVVNFVQSKSEVLINNTGRFLDEILKRIS